MEEKSFAERLTNYRKSHYLTQRQMAALLGISTNHVGVLERGLKIPRASTAARFAELSGRRELRSIGESKPLNETDLENFKILWDGLGAMSALQRAEVMAVFKAIVKWFR